MSIYGTMHGWSVLGHKVFFQAVNGEITDTGPGWEFLSPPTSGEYEDIRDVFVVCCHTEKRGQEYLDPLARMSLVEYDAAMFDKRSRDALRTRIRRGLIGRYGDPMMSATLAEPAAQPSSVPPEAPSSVPPAQSGDEEDGLGLLGAERQGEGVTTDEPDGVSMRVTTSQEARHTDRDPAKE